MQNSYLNIPQTYNQTSNYTQNPIYIPISYQTIDTRPIRQLNQHQIFNQSRVQAHMLNNSIQLQNKSNKWNLQENNNQTNIQGFPFGKDRIKISNYVTQQMQLSTDQENKRILQKFRIDAIKNRNQRVMKHLGKIPYVTQSMLPGSSIDASRFVQKVPQQPIQQPRYISVPIPQYIPVSVQPPPSPKQIMPVLHKIKQTYPTIKYPRQLPSQTKSIGIQVDFQQEFPLDYYKKKNSKKNKKNKRRYYTIEQQQQQQAINRIGDMLNDINSKLKKNSQMLTKSMVQNNLNKSRVQSQSLENKFKYTLKSFFIQQPEMKDNYKRPSVDYTKKRNKTQSGNSNYKYSRSLKDHLNQIKKNRKRLEDLDEYIYRI